ncbi:MAG: 50S ribosomal protein L32e [Thermoproteus sp.]|nr:50S ribosomal protein L32e [Thermoproteus sp.]
MSRPRRELSAELKAALRARLKASRRKPDFVRIDQWRYVRIEDSGWRKPRSLDSKIRRQRKGYPPKVKAGYRKPALARGLHPSGFVEALVHRPEDLDPLDPKTHAVRIAAGVGLRKRLEIVKKARERGFYVLNPGRRTLEALDRAEKAEQQTQAAAQAEEKDKSTTQ